MLYVIYTNLLIIIQIIVGSFSALPGDSLITIASRSFTQLYLIYVPVLLNCGKYNNLSILFYIFLPVWFLLNLWWLPACMMCAWQCTVSRLYDFCSKIGCLPTYLAVWFLPTRMMSAQQCHVCIPVWCLLNCMTSASLCGVCSTWLNAVCLLIWLLLNCMMPSYFEYRILD